MSELKPIVFVVDDDVSVRESLTPLIEFAGWRAETFATAQAFLGYPAPDVPNCLVLDVNLPDLSGLDLQRLLVTERGTMPVIFITGYGDIPTTVRAMKAGAAEFLTKPFPDELLLEAIAAALRQSGAAMIRESAMRAIRTRYASLSQREQEVMALLVTGLLNKQVGGELGISEITVKAHRGRMMRKMGASSFAHLVTIAGQLGLSSAPVSPEAGREDTFGAPE